MGKCCYVASTRRRVTGEERGGGILCRHAHSLGYGGHSSAELRLASAIKEGMLHLVYVMLLVREHFAPCGLRGCKNRPAPFPGQMSLKVTKPGSVCPVSMPRFLLMYVCCAVN